MIYYTDGSCLKNPGGPGGFGVVMLDDNENYIDYHYESCKETTNNREELKAILWVFLKYGVPFGKTAPIVYSDSAYCVNTYTDWMFRWKDNAWKKMNNEIPENLDLIQAFYKHWNHGYRIDLRKVKGHSGNRWNEMADRIASGEVEM